MAGFTYSTLTTAIQNYTEVGTGVLSSTITNTDDYYHFTVDTNTATAGGIAGGGNNCSAGPATLEA